MPRDPTLDALSDGLAAGIVLRLPVEPSLQTRRLMDTLGVRVEVAPMTVTSAAPVTYCTEQGCTWDFAGTRLRGRGYLEVHLRVVHRLDAAAIKQRMAPTENGVESYQRLVGRRDEHLAQAADLAAEIRGAAQAVRDHEDFAALAGLDDA